MSRLARLAHLVAVAGFFLLVSLPMLVQLSGLAYDPGGWENRILASAPPWPRTFADLAKLPRATDAWLRDRFGLRRTLVQLANRLRFDVFTESGNPQIAFGRHHQLFMTSHDAADPQRLLFFLCRGGDDAAVARSSAHALAGFLDDALRHNPHVIDLLVPTKTLIDQRDLPGWMRARCSGGHEALPAILSALADARPDLRPRVVYPLALMRSLHEPETPYPVFNFHWDGPALQVVAAAIATDRFRRPLLAPLPQLAVGKTSDIAHLLPGVPMSFRTREPDLAAAHVTIGAQIPELGASGLILYDVSRFTRHDASGAASGPRLLIISDSFGQAIAPWFSAYYGEVWQVAVNNISQLTRTQQTQLTDQLFDRYRPDDVLFVFHDFSQGYINQLLMQPLWHDPGAP